MVAVFVCAKFNENQIPPSSALFKFDVISACSVKRHKQQNLYFKLLYSSS